MAKHIFKSSYEKLFDKQVFGEIIMSGWRHRFTCLFVTTAEMNKKIDADCSVGGSRANISRQIFIAALNKPGTCMDLPPFNRYLLHHEIDTRIVSLYGSSKQHYCSKSGNGYSSSSKKKEEFYKLLLSKLSDLEDQTRIKGYSTIRLGIMLLAVTGFGVYVFREYIRENVAGEVSTVAYKSLGDETLRLRAHELALALLNQLVNDEEVQAKTVAFLEDISQSPATQSALLNLLLDVLKDEKSLNELVSLLKYLLRTTLSDQAFRDFLAESIKLILQDDNTKQGLVEVFQFILADEKVINSVKGFVAQVMNSKRIKLEATKLGKTVVSGVVEDQNVQQNTGEAIWSALGYSMTPRWFQKRDNSTKTSNEIKEGDSKSNSDQDKPGGDN